MTSHRETAEELSATVKKKGLDETGKLLVDVGRAGSSVLLAPANDISQKRR
jgi:hypothetical protein